MWGSIRAELHMQLTEHTTNFVFQNSCEIVQDCKWFWYDRTFKAYDTHRLVWPHSHSLLPAPSDAIVPCPLLYSFAILSHDPKFSHTSSKLLPLTLGVDQLQWPAARSAHWLSALFSFCRLLWQRRCSYFPSRSSRCSCGPSRQPGPPGSEASQ